MSLGDQRRLPWLQVRPLVTWVRFQRLDCLLGHISPPQLFCLLYWWGREIVLVNSLVLPIFVSKLDAPERCIVDAALHPPCTELELCLFQFEKHVVR